MKRTLCILGFAGLVLAVGCAKLKSLTTINVDIPYSQTVTLPAVPDTTGAIKFPTGGITVTTPVTPVPTQSSQYISNNNTTSKDITSISMKSATLQIINPSGGYFDFLDSISVYLGGNNLPTILLATKRGIPKGQNTLNLDVPVDSSLKSYFLLDTMNVYFTAHFNNPPPKNLSVNSTFTFHMVANPLN